MPEIEDQPQSIPTDIEKTQIQDWLSPIPIDLSDLSKDWSYNTLYYLSRMGYSLGTWNLAETHKDFDVCDNLNQQQWSLTDIINNAQYNPPSPIFTISHPKCYCFLRCLPPASFDSIPNDAPGLPLYGSLEEISALKQQLFVNMMSVDVDFLTLPPDDTHYSLNLQKNKYGKTKYSYSINKPVIISQDFKCLLPLGCYRPMFSGYTGLQISDSDFLVKVFIKELFRIVQIPKQFLTYYDNKEFFKKSPKGLYRIKLREFADGSVQYYDSEVDGFIVSE